MNALNHRSSRLPIDRLAGGFALLVGLALSTSTNAMTASPGGASAVRAAVEDLSYIETIEAVRKGGGRGVVVGPRGGAAIRGGGAVVGPRGGVVVRRGGAYVGPGGGVVVRRGGGYVAPGGGVVVRRGGGYVVPGGGVGVRRGVGFVGPGGGVIRGGVTVVRPYRPWVRRAYYGAIIGGVALGTIIYVS